MCLVLINTSIAYAVILWKLCMKIILNSFPISFCYVYSNFHPNKKNNWSPLTLAVKKTANTGNHKCKLPVKSLLRGKKIYRIKLARRRVTLFGDVSNKCNSQGSNIRVVIHQVRSGRGKINRKEISFYRNNKCQSNNLKKN